MHKLRLQLFITCLVFGIASPNLVPGQNLSEQLGAVYTHFVITSADDTLKVSDQFMIRRAVTDHHMETFVDGAAGYGFGYQSLHFEFISENGIRTIKERRFKHCRLNLFDSHNTLLATIKLDLNEVKLVSNKLSSAKYTYSVNLKRVPIVLLDQTHRVDIVLFRLD